jgi:threonine dehydrogenase-like Zn-dependent dehydrogenase
VKALTVVGPGNVVLGDIEDPAAAAGEVLVAPVLAGLCGTDLEIIDATIDPAYVRYPVILGHEWTGRLPADVDGVGRCGDLVVVEGLITCGACAACAAGDSNRCDVFDEAGFTRPGGLAERVAVPVSLVHRLDSSVDPADAVLIEPMAVVWRALTRLPVAPGRRVAVVGDGTVALLAVHLVRLLDPTCITVVGLRGAQRELARRAGATDFVTTVPDESFDLVIEAAGSAVAAAAAIGLAARGGMVVLLGLPPHGSTIEVAPDALVNNDLVVQGSFSYTRSAWADVVRGVNHGELRPSFLVTLTFSLDAAIDAVAALRAADPDQPRGKVAIALNRR